MPVVARATVRVGGFRDMIHRGRVYEDTDPVVVARPDLFEPAEEAARRRQRPKNTEELGARAMSRKPESTRQAPGEMRNIDYACDCGFRATSEHGLKTHQGKTH